MVFNRKRKDNRSSSIMLDDSPKRTKVQAQRKFAQTSNINSPVLTPVSEMEIPEKVMPEPIELVPMKRPNTEDFLTFLCFRGTPVLPPSLGFFNNATMTEGPPPMSDTPSSSKNGVILPANIKTQGEKPFIAFGVRKRADPVVVSRHMDKKRRHALALQALRRKYQEQKMAKIRAITISKLSEKVHTNKTVVRTTRSITKAEPVSKKSVTQKKITVVATKHVKVTTRRTSIKQTGGSNIKQKMCLRNLRNRVVKREIEKKKTLNSKNIKQEKNSPAKSKEEDENESEEQGDEEEEEVSDEEDEDDDEYESEVSDESNDAKSLKENPPSKKTVDLRITRSNILHNKRRLITQQKLKASPTSPRLRSQLRRKILQGKSEIKVPINAKRRILTRKVQITTKNIAKKVQTKPVKDIKKEVVKSGKTQDTRATTREFARKQQENVKSSKQKLNKSLDDKNKKVDVKAAKETEEKSKKATIDKGKKTDDSAITSPTNSGKGNKKAAKEESKGKKSDDDKQSKKTDDKCKKLDDQSKNDVSEEKDKSKKVPEEKNNKKNAEDKNNKKVVDEKIKKGTESTSNQTINDDNNSNAAPVAKGSKKLTEETNSAKKKVIDKKSRISDTKSNAGEEKEENVVTPKKAEIKSKPKKALPEEKSKIPIEISPKSSDKKVSDKSDIKSSPVIDDTSKTTEEDLPVTAKGKKDLQEIKAKELKQEKDKTQKKTTNEKKEEPSSDTKPLLPVIENNRIVIDKDVIIEEIPFKETPAKKVTNKVEKANSKPVKIDKADKQEKSEETSPSPKVSTKRREQKTVKTTPEIQSQRPTRKTKVAAAIYMEILGRKLVNDDDIDDMSIDSFPELPNVRRMEQRENELKAKMMNAPNANKKQITVNKTDKKRKEPDSDTENEKVTINNKAKGDSENEKTDKRKTRNNSVLRESSSEKSAADNEMRSPPTKILRQTKNSSPNISDTESDKIMLKDVKEMALAKKAKKALAETNESPVTNQSQQEKKKPVLKKRAKKIEDSFSDSDEEPLAKLTQKASEKSKSETESTVKQKRECAKRPQNYLPLFSSSDEEEKFFRQSGPTPKKKAVKVDPVVEPVLSTKDLGRRFGKGKVNMSNEQIEKWLNDSAMAGGMLIKAENDEMLKFGERIPTETSLDGSLNTVNMEHLKNTLLKPTEKSPKLDQEKNPSLHTTPEKSTTSSQKPLSNEKKTIFRKTEVTSKNSNAFSACNESSVYAFEADNEDSVSTPFRRPSRRPSSTATSRSEDELGRLDSENKSKFRLPNNVANKPKQEVSLMLTDESNNSGSITVQVNLEQTDNEPPTQGDNEHMFYLPFQPGTKIGSNIHGVSIKMAEGSNSQKVIMSAKFVRQNSAGSIPDKTTPMFPPSSPNTFKKFERSKACCSMSETSDDFKYKIPSSPSASSSSSAKLVNKKKVNEEFYKPINSTEFPNLLNPSQIVEAPVFHPTEKEFVDPLEYIEKIRDKAEKFGICRIIPPSNFKPECKVLDEMRFTAYNQYVHKMMGRWGPNFRELVAIRKYLTTQSISLKHPPWIGGIEVDLPKLYQTVQSLGGLKEVIEKKKWGRVSELMRIPKSAQDRVTKLDDIYCKYLLPYDTLSPDERTKLFASVDADWSKREAKMLEKAKCLNSVEPEEEDEEGSEDDEDSEGDIECIVKGRSMALSAFYRIARNTMAMWFKEGEPTTTEVEEEFWKHVTEREHHICVHSGSIDSGNLGYGFAVSKNSPFARHAWNLKVLTNNSGSILRSMGPVMGLTVPTLHVGMLYAGCCWYRDPHSLPWIEYLHTGANKIWYGIPDSMSDKFHETMIKLVPHYCLNKSLWLPTDTVMVPPSMLVDNGVSLTRTIQEPGQFVVVFPKAFTSNICAGYVVSESVFWAPPDWLTCADKVFLELRNSCEPSMFSYERLLLSMAEDTRTDVKVLRRIIPPIERMIEREKKERELVKNLGIKKSERLPLLDAKRKKKMQDTDTEYICEDCRWNLYCSMICDSPDNGFYCLEHAIDNIKEKRLEIDNCKLMYTYNDEELNGFVAKIHSTIEAKLIKKIGSKFSGMATLLNR